MTAPVTREPRLARDPVLIRFRAALDALYGARLERVVLFGSRARGDHNADSDYDIAVFLHDFVDRWREVDRLIPIVTDILYDAEEFIHVVPYRAGAYRDPRPLMLEIRADGRDIWNRSLAVKDQLLSFVIPAQAGTHCSNARAVDK